MEEEGVAPAPLARVSSLSVRNAVLHDLTAADDDDDDAIRYRSKNNPAIRKSLNRYCYYNNNA
jgi:hypothetical protein